MDRVDLCVIKYWPKTGLLEVAPDFTFHRKPYRIEVRKMKVASGPVPCVRPPDPDGQCRLFF